VSQLDLLGLVPRCVLPGCQALVDEWGRPCAECLSLTTALGPLLRPVDRPPMTAEAIDERDAAVKAAYERQRAIERGEEKKPGQLCWLCERRRSCTKTPQGWECDECLPVS
jgi:hypothetical protein